MENKIWNAMQVIGRLYEEYLEPVCTQYALTRSELDVLLFLSNYPQYDRAADIIEIRHVAKSHVSLSVKSLMSKGYLKGSYSPENQRDVHLKVTAKADKMIVSGRKAQKEFEKILLKGLSKDAIRHLQESTQKIIENAEGEIK
ncbi:MAG: winged helix-turn-helix transcriptional regulator [Erysipelotrichaceae bacterium]|nr:winged helix-turn-helix transcriptional regulator [Erysipelotrichaceae bacterium]